MISKSKYYQYDIESSTEKWKTYDTGTWGGRRSDAGNKRLYEDKYYPLDHIRLPTELKEAIIKARKANVNPDAMIEAIHELVTDKQESKDASSNKI